MLILLHQQHYQEQCRHVVVHLSPAPQVGVREDLDPPAAHRSKQLEPVLYLSLFQVHDKHQMANLEDIFQDIKLL